MHDKHTNMIKIYLFCTYSIPDVLQVESNSESSDRSTSSSARCSLVLNLNTTDSKKIQIPEQCSCSFSSNISFKMTSVMLLWLNIHISQCYMVTDSSLQCVQHVNFYLLEETRLSNHSVAGIPLSCDTSTSGYMHEEDAFRTFNTCTN